MRGLKHVNEIQVSLVKGKRWTQNDGVSFNLWVVMKLQWRQSLNNYSPQVVWCWRRCWSVWGQEQWYGNWFVVARGDQRGRGGQAVILSNLHFLYEPLQSLTLRQPVYICTNEVFIFYSKQIYSLIDFLCSCTLKINPKKDNKFCSLGKPSFSFFSFK